MNPQLENNSTDDIFDILSHMPKLHRGLHKNIFKKSLADLEAGITRHHLEILRVLDEEGTLHVAEIADMLLISKSQMTRLIDEMIGLGLVERRPDITDRRKSNISLTPNGRAAVDQVMMTLKSTLAVQLASLDKEDLKSLASSLKAISNVLLKMGKGTGELLL